MKIIQDGAAFFFILLVAILSVVSVLGIWEIYDADVISKSFQTLGLIGVVTAVIIAASRFIEARQQVAGLEHIEAPHPAFRSVRHMTIGVLIVSLSLLALLGVLAIWDIITDQDVLYKSIGSMGVVAFASVILVMTCLEREGSELLGKKRNPFSFGGVVVILILLWLTVSLSGLF